MNKRVVLENDKSPSEMEAIVNKYLNDCHDQHELARRIGVHKDYIEEYLPLFRLVKVLHNVKCARLQKQSIGDADAIVTFSPDYQKSIQITLAGNDQSSFFNRIMSTQRQPYFPLSKKVMDRKTKRVIDKGGRILQSPREIVQNVTRDILIAISNKKYDFSKTNILLVVYKDGIRPRYLKTAVKNLVKERFRHLKVSNYSNIYIDIGRSLFKLK